MNALRFVLSIIIGLLGWLVFAFLWWWDIIYRAITIHKLYDLLIIALFSLAVIVISSLWVRYNVWLYRHRKWTGPQQRDPEPYDYSSDKNGLPVVADFASLAEVRYITIDIEERDGKTVKVYGLGDPQQSAGKAMICGP